MTKSTSEKLIPMVAEQLGVEEERVTLKAKFVDDLDADSLDVVELVMNVEEEFQIEIDDTRAGEMETVQDVVDYIESVSE